MTLSGSTPVLVSNVAAALATGATSTGPSFFEPLVWSPDQSKLAVVADWPVSGAGLDDAYCLFMVPTTAPAGGVRLFGSPADAARDVQGPAFSPGGTRLFFVGDLGTTDNNFELYSTADFTAPNQPAAAARLQGVPTNGDVDTVVAGP